MEEKNEKGSSLKKTPKGKKTLSIGIATLIILLVIAGLWFLSSKSLVRVEDTSATIDKLPVWLFRDGQVAVYREINIDSAKDSITKYLVIVNLSSEDQKDLKIYEAIPKAVAEHASDLEFNIQPQIIEDDPVMAWEIATNYAGEKVFLSMGRIVRLNKVLDVCNNEQTLTEMLSLNLKPESIDDCIKYIKLKDQEVQEQIEKNLQSKSEKVEVVQPSSSKYAAIEQEAKEVIKEEIKKAIAEQPISPGNEQNETTTGQEKFPSTVFLSEDVFPQTLLGLARAEIRNQPVEGCHTKYPSSEYLSAVYQGQGKSIIVAISQYYKDKASAQSFPKNCADYTSSQLQGQVDSPVSLENKGLISVYPFYLVKTSYQGNQLLVNSFAVVADTVIQVSMPTGDGGTEAEHREAMQAIINNLNAGCDGDSDCKNWVCENCAAGRKICSQGECVACTYDGHCTDGFNCLNHQCVEKETTITESAPESSEPVCF